MSTVARQRFTPEEYLALERKAEYKSEYLNGQIRPMTSANRWHNLIVGNVVLALHTQLRDRACEAYASMMRVKVSETGLYTYPDEAAVCGEPRFEDSEVDALLNPTVLIEVLSPSTEAYDRGKQAAHYRRLESLSAYVLVAQDWMHVEHYARQGEHWVLTEFSAPEEVLILPALGCEVPLREIYERVDFAVAET